MRRWRCWCAQRWSCWFRQPLEAMGLRVQRGRGSDGAEAQGSRATADRISGLLIDAAVGQSIGAVA